MQLLPLLLAIGVPVLGASQPGRAIDQAQDHASLQRVNVIDGSDERDSLRTIGPALGLSAAEIGRIRRVSGYVGCLSPSPSVGSAALFLNDRQILTAAHVFFEPSGRRRWKCFFKNQDPDPVMIDLNVDATAKFGAKQPKPGSNNDYAIVQLAEPLPGAAPFPVDPDVPVEAGDGLIVITAHPADMQKTVDRGIPVAQACRVKRAVAARSVRTTSFYRSDCDATGASSGGMNLARVGGRLVFRGVTITTGPWQDPAFHGAPYDEAAGSVTTALGTDAAILAGGKEQAARSAARPTPRPTPKPAVRDAVPKALSADPLNGLASDSLR